MDFIPERSEIMVEDIHADDPDVRKLIEELGIRKLVPGMERKTRGRRDH